MSVLPRTCDKKGIYQADSEEEEDLSLVEEVFARKAKVRMIRTKDESKPTQ